MAGTRYAVVGGGIVGASVAYHLGERTDEPVVVYERGQLAAETTAHSTAMIGVAGPDPYHRMKEYGLRLYNEFLADPAAEPKYRQSGRLRVATSPDGAAELARVAAGGAARRAADEGDPESTTDGAEKYANSLVGYVSGDDLPGRFLLPPLETELIEGALYRPEYGYVQDDSRTVGARELAVEFVERARERGVRFETETEVTAVDTGGGSVRSIEIDGRETIAVGTVVCAAGPWNGRLASMAGLDLPVGPVPSPVYALALDEPLPYSLPAIKSHESSVGIHPKRDDLILVTYTPDAAERGSGDDPAAAREGTADAYRDTALEWAERLVPVLGDAELVDEWVGVGTSTPDGGPIAGWTGVDGLALAATPAGIQYAPSVGSIVARQLVDGEPTEYYDAVSLSRFDGYGDRRPREGTD